MAFGPAVLKAVEALPPCLTIDTVYLRQMLTAAVRRQTGGGIVSGVMRSAVLVTLVTLGLGAACATFVQLGEALNGLLDSWLYGGRCGPCPPVADCRELPAVVLGYCCGCRLPFDRVPTRCAPDLICPPNMGKLCRDYNFLMDCCCP